jgi:hypothetical protein
MTGDGTNDAPALAQADVGVAMNTGTQAAKEAGNMVDLDSNPTKLIEIVEIGKQLLMTRGALTTFSIANDVAKYFAIIPAMFAAPIRPRRAQRDGAGHAPQSAILSAVIFNALIIVALIPLALRGVRLPAGRRRGAAAAQPADLRLGGLIAPFVGIKQNTSGAGLRLPRRCRITPQPPAVPILDRSTRHWWRWSRPVSPLCGPPTPAIPRRYPPIWSPLLPADSTHTSARQLPPTRPTA